MSWKIEGEKYLLCGEAAELLDVDPRTLRGWAKKKKIAHVYHPFNDRLLFPEDAIMQAVHAFKKNGIQNHHQK